MRPLPAFPISQAFLYGVLSHPRFNLMLSALEPWLESPSHAYTMHYWKFWVGGGFQALHSGQGSRPPRACSLRAGTTGCLALAGATTAGERRARTPLHARVSPSRPLPLPTPPAWAGLERSPSPFTPGCSPIATHSLLAALLPLGIILPSAYSSQ